MRFECTSVEHINWWDQEPIFSWVKVVQGRRNKVRDKTQGTSDLVLVCCYTKQPLCLNLIHWQNFVFQSAALRLSRAKHQLLTFTATLTGTSNTLTPSCLILNVILSSFESFFKQIWIQIGRIIFLSFASTPFSLLFSHQPSSLR